jgi:hypothetical protein
VWPIAALAFLTALLAGVAVAILKRRRTLAREAIDFVGRARGGTQSLTLEPTQSTSGCPPIPRSPTTTELYELVPLKQLASAPSCEISEQVPDALDESLEHPSIGSGLSATTIRRCEQDRQIGGELADDNKAGPLEPPAQEDEDQDAHHELPQRVVANKPAMRITKRSSGGRGEYEISESFGSLTPRDLINRTIVLDLGSGIEIVTGVRLLLKNGKLRLRIDEAAECEIHLHRQLAAALMLPYPAREESSWGSDTPVMQSELYGIENIALSSVALVDKENARVAVGSLTVVNQLGQEYVQVPERMIDVMRVWERLTDLPSPLASLIAEHKELVVAGGPLGRSAELVVSILQREAVGHSQKDGLDHFTTTHDALPLVLRLLQSASYDITKERATSKTQSEQHPIARITGVKTPELGGSLSSGSSVLTGGNPRPDATASVLGQQEEARVEDEAVESEKGDFQIHRPFLPRKYRPQPRGPVITTRTASRTTPPVEQRDITAPVDLRLRSRIGGTYAVTFLPRRRSGMPSEVEVNHDGNRIQLLAFHEDWYQDVVLPEAGDHLREGLAWHSEGAGGTFRWSLGGREIFVLGTRDDLSGFISVPRLILGAQHFVLCREERLQRVLSLLAECCESIPPALGNSEGFPTGWVGIGPIIPTLALAPSEAGYILDALRPDPAITIELEGGIRLKYNQFLLNYPPEIHVYGYVPAYVEVMIDGEPAENLNNGFMKTGWDSLGEHVVSCGVVSRSYIIVEPEDGWESWPAYSFHLDVQRYLEAPASICGPLVTGGHLGNPVWLVPISTPVLLGSQPGEIYVAPIRQDLRIAVCLALPSFTPIWAVPRNPLRADKSTARILLLQDYTFGLQAIEAPKVPPSKATLQWCIAILDCCRKGLRVEPPEDTALALWRSYRDLARRLWRASR